MTDTIESLRSDIAALSKQAQDLGAVIAVKRAKMDRMVEKANKQNFDSIEWLINNPNTPGQYEAMKAWVTSRFGGEWMGVHPSGYYLEINQQAFSISLCDRWRDEDDDSVKKIANIKAFFAECLHMLMPREDGLVTFTYATGQYSGIFDLAYMPDTSTWWTTNTRYGRLVEKKQHKDLDAAISEALEIQAGVDD